MSHDFAVIRSHVFLPKQKQDAVLARLSEAISHNPFMQEEANTFLYEYRKHKGDEPLSFSSMLELWGWEPTFDQTTGDLVELTSHRTEIENERTLQQFFDLLVPGLDDENEFEVEIDHQRRRYVCFQGKRYQLDATYVYPSLHTVIKRTEDLTEFLQASQGGIWFDSGEEMSLLAFATQAFVQPLYDTFADQHGYYVLIVSEERELNKAHEPMTLCFSLYIPEQEQAIDKWTMRESVNEEKLIAIAQRFSPNKRAEQIIGKATP